MTDAAKGGLNGCCLQIQNKVTYLEEHRTKKYYKRMNSYILALNKN